MQFEVIIKADGTVVWIAETAKAQAFVDKIIRRVKKRAKEKRCSSRK